MLFILWRYIRCCLYGGDVSDVVYMVEMYQMLFIWWKCIRCYLYGGNVSDV